MAKSPLSNPRFQPFALLVVMGLFVAARLYVSFAFPQKSEANDLTASNILSAINKERSLRNLVTLNENGLLDQAAQYKADDMQNRHYFAHVDPDGHYIWDKIVALGYTPYLQLGENLAINFYDTQSLVSAWMQSPTHRENILNSGFRDQGMGVNLGDTSSNQYYSAIANTFGTLAIKPAAPATKSSSQPVVATPKPSTAGATEVTSTPPSAATATPQAITPTTSPSTTPAQGGVQNTQKPQSSAQDINHFITLGIGAILLLLLLSDVYTYIQNRTGHLDKKVNNLALLFLSIIVVAIMYFI